MTEYEILEYIVKIISSNLQELLELDTIIKNNLNKNYNNNEIIRLILTAESTRSKISELVNKAISILENYDNPLPEDIVSDLFALSGYYYLQGYKTDLDSIRALQNEQKYEIMENIYRLRSDFLKLYNITRDSIRERL